MPLVPGCFPDLIIGSVRKHTDTRECSSSGIKETTMAWTTPTLVEICIGLEINGYLPAEF
jgi:coenzyme PQQ precursor peptide PqqA